MSVVGLEILEKGETVLGGLQSICSEREVGKVLLET
jgi:hypothetical protein